VRRLLSPFVDPKIVRKLGVSLGILRPITPNALEEASVKEPAVFEVIPKEERRKGKVTLPVDEICRKEGAIVEIEPIFKSFPNAEKAEPKAAPKPRFFWTEKKWDNGYPKSPEEANTDVMHYLEQRDCYNRLNVLKPKNFCVGSIVAVTRADPNSKTGSVRFVGICIKQNHWQNTLGASFTLRNVIDGEPLEIVFHLYSPLIQKIEVLRHQTRSHEDLCYLRDHPPMDSTVDETMEAVPYTKEPMQYVRPKDDMKRLKKWFKHKRQIKG